jgi:malate permease and related proteins
VSLILKLTPLYLLVWLGYMSGKKLRVNKESIADLLLFVIAPIVVLNGVMTTKLSWTVIAIPFGYFAVAGIIAVISYFILGKFWPGTERNILAFSAGAGNVGYFGLPLVLAVLGDSALGIAILIVFGSILYENTIGFFIVSKSNASLRESLMKVILMPRLHAFVVGVALSLLSVQVPDMLKDFFANARGAYSILGMMLVGIGISNISRASVDYAFMASAFIPRFVIWPAVAIGLILFDSHITHLYTAQVHAVFLLLASVPMASNTVAYASVKGGHPEKTALAVLISTIVAIVFVPLMYNIFSFII